MTVCFSTGTYGGLPCISRCSPQSATSPESHHVLKCQNATSDKAQHITHSNPSHPPPSPCPSPPDALAEEPDSLCCLVKLSWLITHNPQLPHWCPLSFKGSSCPMTHTRKAELHNCFQSRVLHTSHPNKKLKHICMSDFLPSMWCKDFVQALSCELCHLRSFLVFVKEEFGP